MELETCPLLPNDDKRSPFNKTFGALFLGLCFFLLFSAYNTTMFLLTTFFAEYGFYSLILIYTLFAVSCPFSSSIVQRLGTETAMCVSAIGYCIFIGCGILAKHINIPWLIFVGSVPVGIGAGVLWIAQGIYMTNMTKNDIQNLGKYNGMFFSLFGSHLAVGNIVGGLILVFTNLEHYDPAPLLLNMTLNQTKNMTESENAVKEYQPIPEETQFIMLSVLLGFAIVAAILFLFLKKVDVKSEKQDPFVKVVLVELVNVYKAIIDPNFRLWLFYIFSDGLTLSFFFTSFPLLVLDPRSIPWIFTTYGTAFLVTSFVSGKLLDLIHLNYILLIDLLCAFLGHSCVYFGVYQNLLSLLYVSSACFGAMEAFQVVTATTMSIKSLPDNEAGGVAVYRIGSAIGVITGVVIQLYVPWTLVIVLNSVGLFLACLIIFFWFDSERFKGSVIVAHGF